MAHDLETPDRVASVPLLRETAEIGRETVETATVVVRKRVVSESQRIDEPEIVETARVERVPIGREVDAVPEVREEGDTLVIPVVEERVVVERRLVLVEEVRVTRTREQLRHRETVTLRREEVDIERVAAAGADEPGTRS